MSRTRPALLALVALGGLAPTAEAVEPPGDSAAILATFDDVQARLREPDLRLLDARPRADYDAGHLPGAVWVDVKGAEALAARPGGLTDADAWRAWMAPLAIGPRTEVLVYDASRQKDAARIWWLLSYLGVPRVGLIDGGFPLWQAEGRPVTQAIPEVEPRTFPIRFRPERLATRDEVLRAVREGGARVVDARSAEEYTGARALSRKGGHIPSACHLEWSTLVDEHGRFLDAAALRGRLEGLGLEPGRPVIAHCQGGGRASVDAFVLERLGLPARNYYLGWSEWGAAEETPVATGAEPGEGP